MNPSQSLSINSTVAAAGRQSHVGEQHVRLGNTIEGLGNIVANLEQRLNCALRDEPPTKADGPVSQAPPPAPYLVAMADDLRGKIDNLHALGERLNSIFNRLEL